MAKKKRKPDGERPKRRRRPSQTDSPGLPDRRALEGVMRQLVRSLQDDPDEETPLSRSQALMYQAFEEKDEERKVQLARNALEICPDCADAYVLLAEHAPGRKQALALYQQGVTAGERALGPDAFQRDSGHFW